MFSFMDPRRFILRIQKPVNGLHDAKQFHNHWVTIMLIKVLHGWRDDCPVRHSEAEIVIARGNGNNYSNSERCVRCVDMS